MSILIKGMEMPQNCDSCPFLDGFGPYANCTLLHGYIALNRMAENWRLEDCPLVEVPPHGRLIDADAMIRNIEKAITPSRYIKERNADMVKFLSLEDTIIPAEEDE